MKALALIVSEIQPGKLPGSVTYKNMYIHTYAHTHKISPYLYAFLFEERIINMIMMIKGVSHSLYLESEEAQEHEIS